MKRFNFLFLLGLLSSIAPLSTDMYLPALSLVKNDFNVSEALVQLSIASFFIAFAFGQLLYGPISDSVGRKKPLLFGMGLFCISSFLCFSVENIYFFIGFRFLQALGGCAGIVISRAIINDTFSGKELAGVFGLLMICSALAPMISPTIGGFLLKFFHWHSIFILLFSIGFLLFFFVFFGLKESNKYLKKLNTKEVFENYKSVFGDKIYLIYTLCSAVVMGCLFVYISGSSFVFTDFFGLSKQTFGFIFAINSCGFMINAKINAKLCLKYSPKKILKIAFFTMFCFSVLLILSGFFNNAFLFCIMLFCTLTMLGYIMPNTTALAMMRFKRLSGTASSLLGSLQFLIAGFCAIFVGIFRANTPIKLAIFISFLSFCAFFMYLFRVKIVKILSSKNN